MMKVLHDEYIEDPQMGQLPQGPLMRSLAVPHKCRVPFGVYVKKDNNIQIPLKQIEFSADVKNGLSNVQITQEYLNNHKTAIECEYVFPIDYATMAVTGLTIYTGDKVIEGRITEKEKAAEKYVDAVASGNTAYKMDLDEKQPDIVRLNIGNLHAGKSVKIVTKYVKLLEIEDDSWSFRVPVTYTPRYSEQPATDKPPKSSTKQPKVKGAKCPYTWHMSLHVSTSRPITRIVCPSHVVTTTLAPDNLSADVVLAAQSQPPDTDIVVLYRTADFQRPAVLLQKSARHAEVAAMVTFFPRFGPQTPESAGPVDQDRNRIFKTAEEAELSGSGEYLFLLDCSGSMRGPRIALAKNALQMFLQSLPVDSQFNIIVFGDHYKPMTPKSEIYNAASLAHALSFISQVDATMGGTKITSALEFIMAQPYNPQYPRNIFLLTDGAVDDPGATINIVKQNAHKARVHALGIGSGASRFLVKGCAIAGNGCFQFATEGEDLTPKVVAALAKASLPAYTNATLTWPVGTEVLWQTPAATQMANVYQGEPFRVLAILKTVPGDGQGRITLRAFNTATQQPIEFETTIDRPATEGEELYQAAAKGVIEGHVGLQSKDKIQLSLQYSVLSDETAFIAIQRQDTPSTGPMASVKIPIVITKDTPEPIPTHHVGLGAGIGHHPGIRRKDARAPMMMKRSAAPMLERKSRAMPTASEGMKMDMPTMAYAKKEKEMDMDMMEEEVCGAIAIKAKEISVPKSSSSAASSKKLYERIAGTQEFTGQWNWNETTLQILNITKDKAEIIPPVLREKIKDEAVLRDAWITILALARLEISCAADQAAWKLIQKKAIQWLLKLQINYAELKAIATALL